MGELGSDSVDLDVFSYMESQSIQDGAIPLEIFTIVNIDKLLVDERPNGSRMVKVWVVFARFVTNLQLRLEYIR